MIPPGPTPGVPHLPQAFAGSLRSVGISRMRGHVLALDAGFYLAALALVLVLLDLRPVDVDLAVMLGLRGAFRALMRWRRIRSPFERAEPRRGRLTRRRGGHRALGEVTG